MNKYPLFLLSSLLLTQAGLARVIYGPDNRREISDATPFQQQFARSAATMVSANDMRRDPSRPGLVTLTQRTLRQWLESLSSEENNDKVSLLFSKEAQELAQTGISFCEGEPFVDQPNPGMCSGFLIAPDLLVTAGHCAEIPTFCSEYKWVFGFEYNSKTKSAGVNISEGDIYGCKKIISSALSLEAGLDYALIQLDREVKNRPSLDFRVNRQIEDKTSLFVVGSPSGLPLKVADNAQVRDNFHPFYFNANLDTFQGNSGSGVFNAKSGSIEGILVRGENDYVPSQENMCVEANKCSDEGCRGESVTRITAIPEIGVYAAFMKASESGNLDVLGALLKLNFWVDFYAKDRVTALMVASKNAREKVIEALIARGADVNLQDAAGNSALHQLIAVLNPKTEPALISLLKGKPQTNLKNKLGQTPLDVARATNKEALPILSKYNIK
jgi:V8-like Glu-specific endopeptidase